MVKEAALKKHMSELYKRNDDEERTLREQREKQRAEDKPKIDKIINDAKEKVYELLDAEKYPEVKEIVDEHFEYREPRTIKPCRTVFARSSGDQRARRHGVSCGRQA